MLNRALAIMAVMVAMTVASGVARAQTADSSSSLPAAVLEVRAEASILGTDVHLRQIARWSRKDAGYFRDLGELVVARFSPGDYEMTLDAGQVRQLLEGAGVGAGDVLLRGSARVVVTRLDGRSPDAQKSPIPESKELAELLDKKPAPPPSANQLSDDSDSKKGETKPEAQPASATAPPATPPASSSATPSADPVADLVGHQTLRQALTQDLADRLSLPADDIELTFDPRDEKVLRASGPVFQWAINTVRASNLGPVRWTVTLWTGKNASASRKVQLEAQARAWRNLLVLRKAVSANQILREEDIEEKRMLLERMPDAALLTREQALTMQSNRQLPPGTVLTGRTLDPVLLVRTGQVINITLKSGPIEIKAVAKALDGGCYGNTIRAKNEETNEILSVTVTGPQEGRVGPG
jgi:flagella basal body P-ring formation protein FlgA